MLHSYDKHADMLSLLFPQECIDLHCALISDPDHNAMGITGHLCKKTTLQTLLSTITYQISPLHISFSINDHILTYNCSV